MGMLLLVDMGNSNIVLGRIRLPETFEDFQNGDEAIKALKELPDFESPFLDRMLTDRRMNASDYRERISEVLQKHDIAPGDITGCIMSSTVPILTGIIKKALERIIEVPVINLNGGVPCGMPIIRDNPESLGADVIAGAVGAIHLYGCPTAVVDLGTCTTIAVVNKAGEYIGGVIMPGVKSALDGMQANAPHLPEILYDKPDRVMGTDTPTCIQSGLMYGHACAVEGLIRNIWDENGFETNVVATGGFSKRVMTGTKLDFIYERDLIFKGLAIIFVLNMK